jgi:hypothetical protein
MSSMHSGWYGLVVYIVRIGCHRNLVCFALGLNYGCYEWTATKYHFGGLSNKVGDPRLVVRQALSLAPLIEKLQ